MTTKRCQIVVCSLLYFLPAFLFANLSIGLRACNNRWQKTWLYTPGIEVTASYRPFAFQLDGAVGTYQPTKFPNTYSIQSRFSVIPMLQLSPSFFLFRLGYGLSYKFLRNEFQINGDRYHFSSTKKWEGEFRILAGIQFPIFDKTQLYITGGYGYSDMDNYCFSISGGVTIATLSNDSSTPPNTIPYPKFPEEQQQKKEDSPSMDNKTSIRTISIVKQQDPVLADFNTTIESAFLAKKIEVVNWDKLKMDVYQFLKSDSLISNPDTEFETLNRNDIQLAAFASKTMPLDAVIQTQLYYEYETYGKDIFVQTASIKFVQPRTGNVLAIILYDEENRISFPKFKKKVIEDIQSKLEELN